MITLEGWVMIKHLHKEGVPKSRIAEELGLDRRTVDKAINETKLQVWTWFFEICFQRTILYKETIR